MLIHCIACRKLYYLDTDSHEKKCPVCGAQDAEEIAMGVIFEGAGNGMKLKVGGGKQNQDVPKSRPART
jgi:hypothetical protein